jgi:hypothetical protein
MAVTTENQIAEEKAAASLSALEILSQSAIRIEVGGPILPAAFSSARRIFLCNNSVQMSGGKPHVAAHRPDANSLTFVLAGPVRPMPRIAADHASREALDRNHPFYGRES